MSDPNTGEPRMDDPIETGLDKGTGDANDDRTYLDDLPPAQVEDQDDTDETDADA
ncbi:hypothetical protein [Microbacterium profundi]|uniref:hypothetical protein n=1 Tax=Microbacterium profundi TaxID=450380 RepID=UPI000AEAB55C|nr:hypothetical protein [Microbacterium profundi]